MMWRSYYATRVTSKLVHYICALPLPRVLRKKAWTWAACIFGMNLAEAELPLDEYPSFNAFFTRQLKAGVRPIDSTATVVSPADGVLSSFGEFTDGQLIQAKGVYYPADLFLGGNVIRHGSMATIYLSPKDCHRVMSPVDGVLESITIIPGALVPVREPYVSTVPELFGRNERMVMMVTTDTGRVAVVMVGALNVGTMTTPFDENLVTHRWGEGERSRVFSPGKPIKKGDLLGIFHMGSTVVMVADYRWEFLEGVREFLGVRIGKGLV